jgi:hypothetical protein
MLLLLAIYHFAFTQAVPLTSGSTTPLSTRSAVSCDNIDECRKLNDIIWSCITTIFACTWLTLHPNIPPPIVNKEDMAFREKCSYTIKMFLRHQFLPFFVTFIAPEWVLAWAMQQRTVATQIAGDGNAWIRSRYPTYYSYMSVERPWTRVHGFFVLMGGFHAHARGDSELEKYLLGTPLYPLDQKTVINKVKTGEIELPLEGEIQDRSKTDWLAKTLVLLQTGWFVVQCIARGVAHLPLSELEVVTLAYTIINFGIYIAWWDKPRNVDRPIRVFLSPDEVGKERDDESSIKGWKDTLERLLGALTPGLYNVKLSMQSSVPTFYSGKPNHPVDLLPSLYVPSAVGIVFGAIHFIAWSYSFPSHTEQLLWRLSSVIMVGVPACILVGSWLAFLLDGLRHRRNRSSIMEICHNLALLVCVFFAFAFFVLGPLLYVFARVTAFVLAFKTLSSLPVSAFQTILWTKWIPHIQPNYITLYFISVLFLACIIRLNQMASILIQSHVAGRFALGGWS